MPNSCLSRGPVGAVLYDAVALLEIDEAPEHEIGRRGVDEQRRRGLKRDIFVLS